MKMNGNNSIVYIFLILIVVLGIKVIKDRIVIKTAVSLNKDQISPTLVRMGKRPFWDWAQISQTGTFASNGKFGFGFTKIDEDLNFTYEAVVKKFPPEQTSFYAAGDGNILWGKYGYRGFYALDVKSEKTFHTPSFINDGSSDLKTGWAPYSDKPWLLLRATFPKSTSKRMLTSTTLGCFDIQSGEKIFVWENFDNPKGAECQEYLYQIPTGNPGEFYACTYFTDEEIRSPRSVWHLITVDEKGYSLPQYTGLTKAMSEKNFTLTLWYKDTKRWDLKKRFIIGDIQLPFNGSNGDIPTLMRWDEEMEDISFTPIAPLVPEGYRIFKSWIVSPNGEWARAIIKSNDFKDKTYYTCFFHMDTKYPTGMSLGVMGTSSYKGLGIFVEHETLGTLYIDKSPDYSNEITVYKMNDFFPALAEVVKQKAGM